MRNIYLGEARNRLSVCAHVNVGGQRSCIFLCFSSPYLLRQGLSLVCLAREPQESSCLCFPKHWDYRCRLVFMGSVESSSDPHVCTANTLPTEPSLSSPKYTFTFPDLGQTLPCTLEPQHSGCKGGKFKIRGSKSCRLHGKFKASLGYVRSCFKDTTQMQ